MSHIEIVWKDKGRMAILKDKRIDQCTRQSCDQFSQPSDKSHQKYDFSGDCGNCWPNHIYKDNLSSKSRNRQYTSLVLLPPASLWQRSWVITDCTYILSFIYIFHSGNLYLRSFCMCVNYWTIFWTSDSEISVGPLTNISPTYLLSPLGKWVDLLMPSRTYIYLYILTHKRWDSFK